MPKEKQLEAYNAIMEYSLNGKEPASLSSGVRGVFAIIKPILTANAIRYANGKKGGAPKGNSNNPKGRRGKTVETNQEPTKKQPKTNQKLTENQPRTNREPTKNQPNKNYNENYNSNNNNLTPLPPNEGEDEFERFWELYDKKVGKAKAKAKFLKLSKADKEKIFSTLKQYVENTPNPTYRKDPLTYLNGECWNDEIIPRDERQSQTPGNSRPVDHSQFRDPTRHYETVSDF